MVKATQETLSLQLSLSLQPYPDHSWQDFYPGDNRQLVNQLKSFVDNDEFLFYLYGANGCGKTHLLQAVYQSALAQKINAFYVSFKQVSQLSVDFLQGLEHLQLLCLDDLDQIAGQTNWEEALFVLFNQSKSLGGKLLVSSQLSPRYTAWHLADLQSRWQSGLTYRVKSLNDSQMLAALVQRAQLLGLALNEDVQAFLIKRVQRNMHSLVDMLNQLDRASLAEKRRITIPFIKEVLDL